MSHPISSSYLFNDSCEISNILLNKYGNSSAKQSIQLQGSPHQGLLVPFKNVSYVYTDNYLYYIYMIDGLLIKTSIPTFYEKYKEWLKNN
jgi:hypothetical protein